MRTCFASSSERFVCSDAYANVWRRTRFLCLLLFDLFLMLSLLVLQVVSLLLNLLLLPLLELLLPDLPFIVITLHLLLELGDNFRMCFWNPKVPD